MINKFNTENRGIITQLIFDDNTTIPMLKLVTLLGTVKKCPNTSKYLKNQFYSLRNIATMINESTSTTIRSMQKLIEKEVVINKNNTYFLNLGGTNE